MRTTLTLDDDVAVQIEQVSRKRRSGLKPIVNEALRRGLREMCEPARPGSGFTTAEVSLGRCYLDSLDDVAEVLAAVDGEALR